MKDRVIYLFMRYIYIIHQAKVSGFAIIDHRSSLTRSRGPVFVHLILAVHYPVRDLLASETQDKMTSISIDPNIFALKTVECTNLEDARQYTYTYDTSCTLCTPTTSTTFQCDAHTYSVIPFVLGGTVNILLIYV